MWKKIVYLTLILLIPSCEYQIDCPGFPETHLVWMPYIQDEEFSLTDGIDTFQFIVKRIDIEKAYTYKGTKYFTRDYTCFCSAYCTITGPKHVFPLITFNGNAEEGTDLNGDSLTSGHFSINFSYSPTYQFFEFHHHVWNNNVEKVFSSSPEHAEILSSYDNGYKIFNDVLKIESDTLLTDKLIYQIYIAKNVGFIQIKDRGKHKTWNLIE
jgi:hypothetical protein